MRNQSPNPEAEPAAVGAAAPAPEAGIDLSDDSWRRVDAALHVLRSYMKDPIIPAGVLINPLLDLWGPAHDIHAWVAVPVERFLTALLSRTWVASSEVASVADDVSILAREVRSLTSRAAERPAGDPVSV